MFDGKSHAEENHKINTHFENKYTLIKKLSIEGLKNIAIIKILKLIVAKKKKTRENNENVLINIYMVR